MRRQSLFGPLLLILLGVLLLVHNFNPEFPFWELVARYWPVVLLVWGVAKLLEALRRPADQPLTRPSLSFGEFFLAMLLVGVGLAASHAKHVNLGPDWNRIWGREFTFNETLKQENVKPNAPLRIDWPRGEITISGSNTTEILVNATKRVTARHEEEANGQRGQLRLELVAEGAGYLLRASGDPDIRADVEVSVPTTTPMHMETRRGSVQVSNTKGDIEAEMERGDASFSDVAGNIKVQLRRGSISAHNIQGNVEVEGRGSDIQVSDVSGQLLVRGDFTGASDYQRIAQGVRFSSSRTDMEIVKLPGRVDMTIGALSITEPGGAVSINTRNKDIRIEDFSENVKVINQGANIELRTTRLPLKDIEVETHSGTIELSVPSKSDFQIDATARRGDVDSEFPLEADRQQENGFIRGKVGGGAATVKLNTTYGNITLRKTEAGPPRAENLPPLPEENMRKGVRPTPPPKPSMPEFRKQRKRETTV